MTLSNETKTRIFIEWEVRNRLVKVINENDPLDFQQLVTLLIDDNLYFDALNKHEIDKDTLDVFIRSQYTIEMINYPSKRGVEDREWTPVSDRTTESLEVTQKTLVRLGQLVKDSFEVIVKSLIVELNEIYPDSELLENLSSKVLEHLSNKDGKEMVRVRFSPRSHLNSDWGILLNIPYILHNLKLDKLFDNRSEEAYFKEAVISLEALIAEADESQRTYMVNKWATGRSW